jgi:4'-phosphopantetheinyl transferase
VTDVVRAWIVPVEVPRAVEARCLDVLDDGERDRAAAFLNPLDRQRFVIAHGVLRLLVGRELSAAPAELTWRPGRHGKPELDGPGLHTSLSHSAGLIAAAISRSRPVGIDIQHVIAGLDTTALSARFFAPDEARYVATGRNASEQAARFAQLWARKESFVKAAGGRLWPNLGVAVRDRHVVTGAEPPGCCRIADVTAPAGFAAAVSLTGAEPFDVEVNACDVSPSSPPFRSPPAADRGSAAAPDQARARTAVPHHLGG